MNIAYTLITVKYWNSCPSYLPYFLRLQENIKCLVSKQVQRWATKLRRNHGTFLKIRWFPFLGLEFEAESDSTTGSILSSSAWSSRLPWTKSQEWQKKQSTGLQRSYLEYCNVDESLHELQSDGIKILIWSELPEISTTFRAILNPCYK